MIKNYIKVGIRNLIKNKLFTAINMISLAISMSVGLVIITMIHDLLQYDTFHIKKDRIYRVTSDVQYSLYGHHENATATLPVAGKLENFSGIEEVVRIQPRFNGNVDTGDKIIPLKGYFVDKNFFEVFTFPMIDGSVRNALRKPFSLVLLEKASKKLFGQEDPIGKTVEVGEFDSFTVTGIIGDVPKFSHLQFEMLASFNTLPILERDEHLFATIDRWESLQTSYVYLLLEDRKHISKINTELDRISQEAYAGLDNVKASFSLQSIENIIPGPDLSDQIGPKMMYLPIIILSSLAIVIQLEDFLKLR